MTSYNTALAAVIEKTYTPSSWSTYQIVVSANVKTAEDTQDSVNTATANISAAQGSLVLKLAQYNLALGAVNESDHTIISWSAYQIVVGNNVVTTDNTQGQVDIATGNITAAQSLLIDISDLTNYNAALNAVVQAGYTPASWATYQDVVTANERTIQDLQSAVDISTSNITSAQGSLVFAGKPDLLLAKIAVANLVPLQVSGEYTSTSWGYVSAALELSETSNALVVAKTIAINNAIDGLVFAGQAALDAAEAVAAGKDEEDYTPGSWTALEDARELAQTTNALVLAKTTAINNALGGLVFAGLADLNIAKASITGKIQSDYTSGSWTALTNAIALPETTNDEIVAKTTAINNAISGLVFVGQADLDAAKAAEDLLNPADYVDYSAVTSALGLSESANMLVVFKTGAINNAIAGLVFAGQADLDAAIAAEDLLTPANYIDYSAVTTALTMPETTNTEVVAKTNAINLAISNLVEELTHPVVNVGEHQHAYINMVRTFTGTSTDNESGVNSNLWTKEVGTGVVTFGTDNILSTTVRADTAGTYTLRLTSIDKVGNSDYDETNLYIHKSGDIDNDGFVDEDDFTILMFNWGDIIVNDMADYTRDSVVDEDDFTIMMFRWNPELPL